MIQIHTNEKQLLVGLKVFVSLVLAKQIDRQVDDSSGHVFMSPE